MRLGVVLLAALVLACGPDVAGELRSEIAALEEARMPLDAFEQMRAEADHAETAAAAAGEEVEALRAGLAGREARVASLEASFQREVARNEMLRAEIEAEQARLVGAGMRRGRLEQEVARHRARARTVADQADVLARELRPSDPPWARELRLRTLRDFLEDVRATYDHDGALAALAAETLPDEPTAAVDRGARVAAQVRDHMTEVYGLEASEPDGDPVDVSRAVAP